MSYSHKRMKPKVRDPMAVTDSDIARYKQGYSPRQAVEMDPTGPDVELSILSPKKPAARADVEAASSSSEASSVDEDTTSGCPPCCPLFSPCSVLTSSVEIAQHTVGRLVAAHKRTIRTVLLCLLLLLFTAYLGWAISCGVRRAAPLIVCTVIILLGVAHTRIADRFGERISDNFIIPVCACIDRVWFVIKWIIYFLIAGGLVVYVTIEVDPHPRQLISLLGLVVFMMLLFVFSKHPGKVKLRPVLWGLGLQFTLAVIVLRTRWGYTFFHWFGQRVVTFLNFTDYGAKFVFGESFLDHFFAFKVLSVVVFFSSVISILYHLGIMQIVIQKIAWIMQRTMHTSATESLIAASNIFIGQSEAPILIRPFISSMTKSELHAMMTAGFATIAGGVLAAYIMFGIPAEHLICASVMNAPIALAVSKLFYPETEKTAITCEDIKLEKGRERNVLEAASTGASASISLAANIAANLISFLALLAFINATVSWIGSLVDHPEWTFQLLCSYLFMPVAFLMGVDWADCQIVGELIGVKIFLNEFVAYEQLGVLINNRQMGVLPQISVRSQLIVTYALCGFANLSSIAIQLGCIGPMAPERKADLAALAGRALIAGTTACLITACVAGILTVENLSAHCPYNSTAYNSTACILHVMDTNSSVNINL